MKKRTSRKNAGLFYPSDNLNNIKAKCHSERERRKIK